MPDLNAILSAGSPINEAHRAALAWRRISEKPTSITIRRAGATQTAQTVRVEFSEASNQRMGASGDGAVRDVIIFGVRNHPDEDIADTDIEKGDRFVHLDVEYTVRDLVTTLGEVQAHCEAVS
jgi:hypothetical protein